MCHFQFFSLIHFQHNALNKRLSEENWNAARLAQMVARTSDKLCLSVILRLYTFEVFA